MLLSVELIKRTEAFIDLRTSHESTVDTLRPRLACERVAASVPSRVPAPEAALHIVVDVLATLEDRANTQNEGIPAPVLALAPTPSPSPRCEPDLYRREAFSGRRVPRAVVATQVPEAARCGL